MTKSSSKMIEDGEKSPLIKTGNDIADTRPTKTLPFLRCAISSGLITYLVFLVAVSAAPTISQYVHAKLLHEYHVNSTSDGGSSCSANNTISKDDPLIRAQEETSNFLLLLAVTNNVPAVFINVVLGSVSDYLGRKMMFFIPALGFFLKNVFCVLIMFYELDIQYFYIAYAVEGLGGSGCAFIAATFSYMADITSSGRGRIIATTAVEVCLALAAATGTLLTGFLIPAIGYLDLSIVMSSIAFLACVLLVFLPETRHGTERNPQSILQHFRNVFGFYVFKKEKDKDDRRVIYILLMTIFLFAVLSVLGRLNVETLYGLAEPFCFNSVQVGYFGALRAVLSNLGAMLAIKFLQRHLRDETIALIGAVDSAISCVLEGLATSGWMLYLVPVVGIVSSTTVPIIRGSMSRMTSPHEQGAIFAGIGFVETIMNLLCQVMYSGVYSATVASLSGAVFLLMASFSGVTSVLVIIWIVIRPKYQHIYTIYVSKEEEDVAISKESQFSSSQVVGI